MEGTRERYKRALRWRAANELEEVRENFWTNANATTNEAKICKSDENRNTKDSQRER